MNLNDALIRSSLLEKLRKRKPRAIIEELHVHNGNAIADIVALESEAHCYEIKGSNDKIERIRNQGSYYNRVFRRITLVTTENHLDKALNLTSPHWGIMLASFSNEKVIIRHIRHCRVNPLFDKEKALRTLWKSEMLELLQESKHKSSSREVLTQLIAESAKKVQLSVQICAILIQRSQKFSNR